MTKQYKLPPAFWYDHHVNRACSQTATVVRQTKTYVVVDLDQTAYDDLRSDCEYYVSMGAAGAFDAGLVGLVASARATLKRLDADPMAATHDGHLGLPALLAEQERAFAAPPVRRRYVFRNPGDGYPLTISAYGTSEQQARRAIAADLPRTADWPLERSDAA